MNLANKITLTRLFMVPIFIITMYVLPHYSPIPLIIFSVAAATDALDGYVARHYNMVTSFGKFVDPLVDKILVLSAFCLMLERLALPGWILVIIVARELIITGFRTIAVEKGVTIAASPLGKIKTISQMLSIIVYFLSLITGSLWGLYTFLIYFAMLATLVSGIDYLVKNKNVLEG
ncbi:MAG: CDP-diacylglycerol--glycerol-3-phosphate 3-phosphatidyltransferase [Bacillota bacterium]|nr:CDP-diacylglycerol--glycerol-3-phosphate 3-phosphatidyltransferase [Bacillota bacterium]